MTDVMIMVGVACGGLVWAYLAFLGAGLGIEGNPMTNDDLRTRIISILRDNLADPDSLGIHQGEGAEWLADLLVTKLGLREQRGLFTDDGYQARYVTPWEPADD